MVQENRSIIVNDISELEQAAHQLVKLSQGQPVWLFTGGMGAGKTTLVKAICKALGVINTVQSPTFSIVNEYTGADKPVYHFDLYRLKEEEELFEIGFDEYIDSGNYCFIEWPNLAENFWPDTYFHVSIIVSEQGQREIIGSIVSI